MKIIIFDDDPTGSQTVYGCPLLLSWDKETLINGLQHTSPLLFILTNTRAFSSKEAEERTREICIAIKQVLDDLNYLPEDIQFISRGDSTLRGHGVLEPQVMHELLGPFDATFHAPAFFEGGRITIDGIHLLNGSPVHTTPFARDSLFGYSTSKLDEWLEEKSKGVIQAQDVEHLTINLLDSATHSVEGRATLLNWLLDLKDNKSVVVDAQLPKHFEVLGATVEMLHGKKRFLFRTAASFINGLANLPKNPLNVKDLVSLRIRNDFGNLKPGLIIVGSHVPLADEQLRELLNQTSCVGVELSVETIARVWKGDSSQEVLSEMQHNYLISLNDILASSKTPVLFTSRGEMFFQSKIDRVDFGNFLAQFMVSIAAKMLSNIGYIISKGGITTQTLLLNGLNLSSVQLRGQLIPGLSIVSEQPQFNDQNIPIITFPGNLGDKNTLRDVFNLMESMQ